MKYGNFLPLLTSSQADMTLFVNGLGPHENTPILLTFCNKKLLIIISFVVVIKLIYDNTYITVFLLYEFKK